MCAPKERKGRMLLQNIVLNKNIHQKGITHNRVKNAPQTCLLAHVAVVAFSNGIGTAHAGQVSSNTGAVERSCSTLPDKNSPNDLISEGAVGRFDCGMMRCRKEISLCPKQLETAERCLSRTRRMCLHTRPCRRCATTPHAARRSSLSANFYAYCQSRFYRVKHTYPRKVGQR